MKLRLAIQQNLNFFRVHLLFFIFTPLIFSAIFFVSNGSFHISYIDSLFVCVSSITVTGLTTVDLSGLTGWQQAILFIQVCIGNVVAIAWVTVWYRRRLFIHKFNHLLRKDRSMKHNAENEKESIPVARHRGSEILARNAQDHLSIQHDVTLKSQLQRQHPSNNKATHSAGHNASYEAHPTNAGPRSKEPVPASSLDQHYAECAGGPSKAHLPTVMSEGRSKDMALGGFSSPHSFLFNFIFKMWPGLQRRWATAITQPHLRLFTPHENSHPDAEAAPYLKFAAFVGKNSRFFGLKKSHKEELGNMEYQALTALMWIVAVYHIGIQIICFTVLSPYMSAKRWRSALDVPQLHRNVSPVWSVAT
ncbi:hypothetical protein BD410DRAFT_185413 [Rickenella mellea]|uniref:TrkH-domain-containing protein n=1 Tax=Rickenella mellea TaxID=50990 RepID=A0A4Y7Q5Q7_9AGAM|nr:hypothetical protein BD410DRAFT_185413 [Rickenella mellea]